MTGTKRPPKRSIPRRSESTLGERGRPGTKVTRHLRVGEEESEGGPAPEPLWKRLDEDRGTFVYGIRELTFVVGVGVTGINKILF